MTQAAMSQTVPARIHNEPGIHLPRRYSVQGLRSSWYNGAMIRKVAKLYHMDEFDEVKENLRYWLTRPPEERLDAVDELRHEWYGDQRLQRTARVVPQARD